MNGGPGADGGAVMRCRSKGIEEDRPAGEKQWKNQREKKITKYEIERGDRRDLHLR